MIDMIMIKHFSKKQKVYYIYIIYHKTDFSTYKD